MESSIPVRKCIGTIEYIMFVIMGIKFKLWSGIFSNLQEGSFSCLDLIDSQSHVANYINVRYFSIGLLNYC
jgi:hypothetical protein